ncbi:MAG: hypothetical protein ACWA5X_02115 [bacterium]
MSKQYGIRITLPENSTMSMDHLLGKNWESYRWFDDEASRDIAYTHMLTPPSNYRYLEDAKISQVLEKVERTQ